MKSLMEKILSKFITIEGIEGAGKTTAVSFVQSFLQEKKIPFIVTREPGGTPIAEEIRRVLLHHHNESMTDITELLLFFAARAQHLENTILPALNSGKWVVCDRFVDASFAYQGGGRKLPLTLLQCLEKYVLKGKQPNLTILLDLPVSVGMSRIKTRGQHDRIEQEKQIFFESVRQSYLKRAAQFTQRFNILDADCSMAMMKTRLYTLLTDFLNRQC